ncbi:oligoendopeptidase F [Planococcus lenghuensis]|uniref:Oligopeptidase F n=1 Tax=Planococcus lenghuensis TaxID=2213202 RepID=A0A1Q2KYY2_9BACL|nr:oligoendopeptidase F [Planococcus lenghuensis]AQQ53401.1 oligoendopeptidase F [Planococcus lenghuensis]
MTNTKQRPLRSEVPEEQKWDLRAIFQSRDEWEKELTAIQGDTSTVTKFKGKLDENAKTLLDCLEAKEQLLQRLNLVTMYANLRQAMDNTDATRQKDSQRASQTDASVKASLAFVEAETISLPEETLDRFMEEEKELQSFRKYLRDLQARKPYTLTEETEETLAALGSLFNAPYTIYNRGKLSDMEFEPFADEEGNEVPLSFGAYASNFSTSPSKTVRRNAYKAFNKGLERYKHTFAATYATQVNHEVTTARLRGYDSATDMLLQGQRVTDEMYHNQLDVIQQELAPHMRKYAELKRRVLGLETMTFADLKAPLDPDFEIEMDFEEAADTVEKALDIMGADYSDMIKTAIAEGWVDYADNVGKSTGASCSSPYGAHPYVMMTWPGTMRGAFTLAHELGHGGHFYFAEKNQRMTNARPSRYFIEAPSTMNEMLLGNYLLSNTDDKRKRRWLILQLLGTYYHNFVTHLLEGEYQRRIYATAEKGEPLTASVFSEVTQQVLKDFWGDAVEIDEGAGLVWMHQPHYYMGLYPYTYSAGLTVSTIASKAIFDEGQPAVERWLDVLKTGGTLDPLELIKKAGIDMSEPKPIRRAVAHVGSLIDELAESYD